MPTATAANALTHTTATTDTGTGLVVPGNPGLGEETFARVRKWALVDGSAWRAAFAAAPTEACQAGSGLCASLPGSPDFAKLLVATSPADYRSAAVVPAAVTQQPCRSSTAAALTLAAEAAVASALQLDAAAQLLAVDVNNAVAAAAGSMPTLERLLEYAAKLSAAATKEKKNLKRK